MVTVLMANDLNYSVFVSKSKVLISKICPDTVITLSSKPSVVGRKVSTQNVQVLLTRTCDCHIMWQKKLQIRLDILVGGLQLASL